MLHAEVFQMTEQILPSHDCGGVCEVEICLQEISAVMEISADTVHGDLFVFFPISLFLDSILGTASVTFYLHLPTERMIIIIIIIIIFFTIIKLNQLLSLSCARLCIKHFKLF